MFKNLRRELKRIERMKSVSVPISLDSDGYLDKECPAEECLFSFKVFGEDWTNLAEDAEAYCPSCRHSAPADAWYARAQLEAARDYVRRTVANSIKDSLKKDAAASKYRSSGGSFIAVTLNVEGGNRSVLLPVAAAEPMRLRATCETCGCRYSYLGAAYFCPVCGENSASHTFIQALKISRNAAGLDAVLRDALEPDDAEVMIRTLLEKAIQDTVMSFQRLNEQLYEKQSGGVARRNAFQRLDSGSDLWKAQIGYGYADLIGSAKLDRLKVFFQQRHLLAHRQGIVDDDYIERSGDTTYAVGQRLLIRGAAVREFTYLVEELVCALQNKLGGVDARL